MGHRGMQGFRIRVVPFLGVPINRTIVLRAHVYIYSCISVLCWDIGLREVGDLGFDFRILVLDLSGL